MNFEYLRRREENFVIKIRTFAPVYSEKQLGSSKDLLREGYLWWYTKSFTRNNSYFLKRIQR